MTSVILTSPANLLFAAVLVQSDPDFRRGHHGGERRECPSQRLRRRYCGGRFGEEHSWTEGHGQDSPVGVCSSPRLGAPRHALTDGSLDLPEKSW